MHIQHVSQQIVYEFEGILYSVNIIARRLNRLFCSERFLFVDCCLDKAASGHCGAHGITHLNGKEKHGVGHRWHCSFFTQATCHIATYLMSQKVILR
jgi:hypothetical protein